MSVRDWEWDRGSGDMKVRLKKKRVKDIPKSLAKLIA